MGRRRRPAREDPRTRATRPREPRVITGRFGLYARAVLYTVLAPGTVVGLVPVALSRRLPLHLGAYRFAGLPLVAAGVAGLLWCIFDFATKGRGTLNPVDAPRFLVRGGLYRHVRNPMYVSNVVTLTGEALFLQSSAILIWLGVVFTAFHAFTVGYEEPKLKRLFGDEYESYRATVPRWIPRP